jgi:hypothetical protein
MQCNEWNPPGKAPEASLECGLNEKGRAKTPVLFIPQPNSLPE